MLYLCIRFQLKLFHGCLILASKDQLILTPLTFSESNYSLPAHNLRKSKFRISMRAPLLWNNFLSKSAKSLETMSLFKSKVKNNLLVLENEAKYFQ